MIFNPNNIRDISYRKDTITLETMCYKIYDKSNNDSLLGWYPVPPNDVVYRYTVWGKYNDTATSINDSYYPYKSDNNNCTARVDREDKSVQISCKIACANSVKLHIYDSIGKMVYNVNKECNGFVGDMIFSVKTNNMPTGAYYVVVTSGKEYAFCSFVNIQQ